MLGKVGWVCSKHERDTLAPFFDGASLCCDHEGCYKMMSQKGSNFSQVPPSVCAADMELRGP